MPDNIDIFNNCVERVLNKLNRNFPKTMTLRISDFEEFNHNDKSTIFFDTVRFLESEGYLKFSKSIYGGFSGVVLTSKGLHMDISKQILTEIKEGKKSFKPASNSQSDMEDFQSVAKILHHADKQGWLDSFKAHRESRTANQWYDQILVQNGLSHKGEQYLKNIPSENNRHRDGIEPEPPSFIKNIKWFLLYWKKSLKYLAIGLIILGLYFAITHRENLLGFLPKNNSEKKSTLEPETRKKPGTTKSKTKPPQVKSDKPKSHEDKNDKFQNIPSFVSIPVLSEEELLIELMGSFEKVSVSGSGSLTIAFSTDKKIARYERIIFESDQINTTLYGRFKTTSDFEDKLVILNMKFRIFMETKYPSKELSILPKAGGKFKVENFFTSHCHFSCYQLKIAGDWSADVEGENRTGKIDSMFTGRGLGADTHSEIDLTSYPDNILLKNFRWHGNSGGTEIPSLIDEIIEEIPIKVSAHSVNTGHFVFKQMELLAQR